MNHLAHALVADRSGTSLVGNLLGDFVKGSPETRYEGELLRGIRLHRRIDVLTDGHRLFRRSRARIRNDLRRYSGILVDLFYDHLLARRWEEYSEVPLPAFADRVYSELEAARDELPDRMQRFVSFMIRTDLLVSYRDQEGIGTALTGISRRMRRRNPLAGAGTELTRIENGLGEDFRGFFPDLLREVEGGWGSRTNAPRPGSSPGEGPRTLPRERRVR